jgi:hypothetical protein
LLPKPEPATDGRLAEIEALARDGRWQTLAALLADSADPVEGEIAAFAGRMDADGLEDRIVIHHHCLAGRVEHFHHYMGAILLPVLQLIDIGAIAAGDRLLVPDCGPMNARMEEIGGHFGFVVATYPQPLSDALGAAAACRHFHLPAYDKTHDSDFFMRPHQIARVRRAAFAVAGVAAGAPPAAGEPARVLLIDRAPPLDYYASKAYPHAPNREGLSGSARRSLPNIGDLETRLAKDHAVRRVFLERMSLAEQIRTFTDVDVIIGQHGAGLNGLLWSRPGASLIEIIPVTNLGHQFTYFSNMAEALGVRHYHVVQATPHDAIDCALIERFVAAAVADMRG